MIEKAGNLVSEAYLEFVRGLPCCLCFSDPPSEAHHHPPKGRGITRDDKTMPVCRLCHMRCHGETVVISKRGPLWTVGGKWSQGDLERANEAILTARLGPISEARQAKLVEVTRLKFLEYASTERFAAYAADRARWMATRVEAVPW